MDDGSTKTSSLYFREGNTAVITGASSGIGRAAALSCSSMGMNVWLVDIDETDLELAKTMAKDKAKSTDQVIECALADVSDLSAMEQLSEKVFANGGKCHVLMNNAGIGIGKGPLTPMPTFLKSMSVNVYGPIHGCLSFIPKMKQLNEHGLIVNTGSKQGITMPPGGLVYNTSKAALKTYTEGLEFELAKERRESDGKLRAALLVPGWVNTSIALKASKQRAEAAGETFDPNSVFFHEDKPATGAWMPNQVIDFMLGEIDKDRFYIICPDNDVNRETDNLRMTWTMQDITENRPPLSRWHPDYKDQFAAFLAKNKNK